MGYPPPPAPVNPYRPAPKPKGLRALFRFLGFGRGKPKRVAVVKREADGGYSWTLYQDGKRGLTSAPRSFASHPAAVQDVRETVGEVQLAYSPTESEKANGLRPGYPPPPPRPRPKG